MTTKDARTCNIEGCPTPGHTPGKWAKGHYLKTPTVFWERGNGTVAIATFHDIASIGDPEANAELFTRSPDLAHALAGLVKGIKAMDSDAVQVAMAAAEAALKGDSDA